MLVDLCFGKTPLSYVYSEADLDWSKFAGGFTLLANLHNFRLGLEMQLCQHLHVLCRLAWLGLELA